MEIIIRNDMGVTTFTTVASFETFRNYCLTGQKIDAIKFMREKESGWSLEEAKDFVEACDFPTVASDTTLPQFSSSPTENFLSDIKGDLREIILAGKDYRDSLLIDLFGRVSGKLGYRY